MHICKYPIAPTHANTELVVLGIKLVIPFVRRMLPLIIKSIGDRKDAYTNLIVHIIHKYLQHLTMIHSN